MVAIHYITDLFDIGTRRFILANTEQLHEKITQLSDRVRQLEEALETVQSTNTDRPHPLLAPDLLRIKTSQDLYGVHQSAAPPLPDSSTSYKERPPDPAGSPSLDHPSIGSSRAMEGPQFPVMTESPHRRFFPIFYSSALPSHSRGLSTLQSGNAYEKHYPLDTKHRPSAKRHRGMPSGSKFIIPHPSFVRV